MEQATQKSKAGRNSIALNTGAKRGLWGCSGDLEFTLTPSLCFLKWFSHFSISEWSGQTDRQTPTLYHGQTWAENVVRCVCWEAGSPVTRPPPSTPHDWGRDRSSDAATESKRGSRASACSRALCSPSPGRSLHPDTHRLDRTSVDELTILPSQLF